MIDNPPCPWTNVKATREKLAAGEVEALRAAFSQTQRSHRATLLSLSPEELARLILSEPRRNLYARNYFTREIACLAQEFSQGNLVGKRRSLSLYDVLVRADYPDLALYCNALWTVQKDNSKLGVQPTRALAYLDACLSRGPENPAIFFNAACVAVELGDVELALEQTRSAVRFGYDDLPKMRRAIEREPLFAPVRSDSRFRGALSDDTAVPLEVCLRKLLSAYGRHFLEPSLTMPAFTASMRHGAIELRVKGAKTATITERASAYLSLCGRFWALAQTDDDKPSALLPLLTGYPDGGSNSAAPWDNFHREGAVQGALRQLARQVVRVDELDAVLLLRRIYRVDNDWWDDPHEETFAEFPKSAATASRERVKAITPLVGKKTYSPGSMLKAVAPFATSSDARDRLAVATIIDEALSHLTYSNVLLFERVATPALRALLREPRDAIYEVALGAMQALAQKLFQSKAYAEALPMFDTLVSEHVALDESLRARWECRLYLGDASAEEDWTRAAALDTPTAASSLGPCWFWVGDVTDRRALALSRVAKAMIVRSEGKDPCEDRKLRKGDALSDTDRARLVSRAQELSDQSLGLAGPRIEADATRARGEVSVPGRGFQAEELATRAKVREASGDFQGALEDYRAARTQRVMGGVSYQFDHYGDDVRRVARTLAGNDDHKIPPFSPAWLCDPRRTEGEQEEARIVWTKQPWRVFPEKGASSKDFPLAYVLLRDIASYSAKLWGFAAKRHVELGDRIAFAERARPLLDEYAERRDASRLESVLDNSYEVAIHGESSDLDKWPDAEAKRLMSWMKALASATKLDEQTVLSVLNPSEWRNLRALFEMGASHYDRLRDVFDASANAGLSGSQLASVVRAYDELLRHDWSARDRPDRDWEQLGKTLVTLDAGRLAPALVAWTREEQSIKGYFGLQRLSAKWLWPLFYAWDPSTEPFLVEVLLKRLDNGKRLTTKQRRTRRSCLEWFAASHSLPTLREHLR